MARPPGQRRRGRCRASARRPDRTAARLCQLASSSEDRSRIITTPGSAGRSFPRWWLAVGHPAPATPARSCLLAAGSGRSTGNPWGWQEGEQNGPKKLLKAAGKSRTIYNEKGRYIWRERSGRGFLQTSTARAQRRGVCVCVFEGAADGEEPVHLNW